jgi:hypothetical protein
VDFRDGRIKMKFVFLLFFFLIWHVASSTAYYPPRVKVPVGTLFTNNAWGFPNGGPSQGANVTGRLVVIVDIDGVTPKQMKTLKAQGHIVQCYFSVGTAESWRPDYIANPKAWLAVSLGIDPTWGEAWLDIRQLSKVTSLMGPRFQRAKSMGCDAIEADNVDCYAQSACKGKMKNVTLAQAYQYQITYNLWQLNISHSLGLSLSLKNAQELLQFPQMQNVYDFAVNEQCFYYDECDLYHSSFVTQNKAVFNTEYTLANVCSKAAAAKITSNLCAGSNSNGLCNGGTKANWVSCNAPVIPLPNIAYTTT